ncbi:biopolymer transporter ExbD [Gammaproteobacteria bacterium 45_16_T64]|nr:biopolymer transporter ExbD [Gammaproteobacteria bacterium 45_16_T64]
MRGHSRRSRGEDAEINITAFMNLMVVLVPFLLITAVFSQVTVLELNLPAGSQAQQDNSKKKPLILEILIYADRLEIVDRQSGPLKIVRSANGTYDYASMKTTLKAIKSRFPAITEVTLLLEENTPYNVLVQTMDSVRYGNQLINGQSIKTELFPDISIGDAPPDTAATSASSNGGKA